MARLEKGGGKPPVEAVLLDIPAVSFFLAVADLRKGYVDGS